MVQREGRKPPPLAGSAEDHGHCADASAYLQVQSFLAFVNPEKALAEDFLVCWFPLFLASNLKFFRFSFEFALATVDTGSKLVPRDPALRRSQSHTPQSWRTHDMSTSFEPGDKVAITAGAFAGKTGTVRSVWPAGHRQAYPKHDTAHVVVKGLPAGLNISTQRVADLRPA